MVRSIEKRRIVDDETDRRDFVRRLGALAEDTRTPIYAWALMSNHVHILLCSGALGLAKFMRRLLTGHAVSYNLRHRWHGHVFQNRYKSIVCDGDSYFTELVRYIHLNPLLGTPERQWQDCQSVLAQFGRRASEAKEAYRRFVAEGVTLRRRPELVEGGLARLAEEWFAVRSQRPRRAQELSDERILGSGEFVEAFLAKRMHERCGNMQRERQIVTPSVSWLRNARRAECR